MLMYIWKVFSFKPVNMKDIVFLIFLFKEYLSVYFSSEKKTWVTLLHHRLLLKLSILSSVLKVNRGMPILGNSTGSESPRFKSLTDCKNCLGWSEKW